MMYETEIDEEEEENGEEEEEEKKKRQEAEIRDCLYDEWPARERKAGQDERRAEHKERPRLAPLPLLQL